MSRSTMGGRPLRVGLLAPVALPLPPVGYGGVEAVVHDLRRALENRGIEVVLAAAGTPLALLESPVGLALPPAEGHALDLAHVARALALLEGVDVIHDHTKAAGAALAGFSPVPIVTTVHNDANPLRQAIYRSSGEHPLVFLSAAQAARYPGLEPFAIVPNGLDIGSAPFRKRKEDYLLFLGRFSRVKGAHEAIAVARAVGAPLVLAGCVDPTDRAYFDEAIAPEIDGSTVKLAGEVGGAAKWDLLSRARALIAPLLWEEPFGLVLIEAMACGTPVLAYGRGAAPEIVSSGRTGWLARDRQGLVQAFSALGTIDPRACRQEVAERFSAQAMAEGYLKVYERLLERGRNEPSAGDADRGSGWSGDGSGRGVTARAVGG